MKVNNFSLTDETGPAQAGSRISQTGFPLVDHVVVVKWRRHRSDLSDERCRVSEGPDRRREGRTSGVRNADAVRFGGPVPATPIRDEAGVEQQRAAAVLQSLAAYLAEMAAICAQNPNEGCSCW
ncbi:hypothetical protein [Micromonospora endophytica]|uniref:hypothetical protein n=1 Tax=Micromonospora endophytica TaxID=515350 RepID=UPI0011B812BF|nr:hypothetical protein [Micromonospora endophytica]